jgi:hypothetical protein
LSTTEDKLDAIPALAVEVKNALRTRADYAAKNTRESEAELAVGCTSCGKAWRDHFRRGDWRGCR